LTRSSAASAAAYPVGLDATGEAIGFGAGFLVVPGCGGGAWAGHMVRAVEAAGDEVGVETLEFAVD